MNFSYFVSVSNEKGQRDREIWGDIRGEREKERLLAQECSWSLQHRCKKNNRQQLTAFLIAAVNLPLSMKVSRYPTSRESTQAKDGAQPPWSLALFFSDLNSIQGPSGAILSSCLSKESEKRRRKGFLATFEMYLENHLNGICG